LTILITKSHIASEAVLHASVGGHACFVIDISAHACFTIVENALFHSLARHNRTRGRVDVAALFAEIEILPAHEALGRIAVGTIIVIITAVIALYISLISYFLSQWVHNW
jgi:hypothetical protein